ncbi:MAG: hypothetical protein N3A66_11000, partial [Planctomycetota bacterium]|nr:hypothetical protein [Planctomycetota bacterium]
LVGSEMCIRDRCLMMFPALAFSALFCLIWAAEDKPQESAGPLPRTRQLLAAKKPVRVVLYGDSISEVKKGWSGGASAPENKLGCGAGEKTERDLSWRGLQHPALRFWP